jgi:hypothetical protein
MAVNKEVDLRFVVGYTPWEFRDTLHRTPATYWKCPSTSARRPPAAGDLPSWPDTAQATATVALWRRLPRDKSDRYGATPS